MNYFTEVSGEEAYYWLFSQHLDLGYLDHPPILAYILKPGFWLFQNNLGLRLGILLLSILTFVVIRKTLAVKNDRLFIWILMGLLPVHLGSLIVKTDVPLLFFTACFFFLYKKYLEKDNLKTILLLAICTVLMILSKYHGVLVVFFTVISNPGLFRKRSFYTVTGLSLILIMPHLYWLYEHDYSTIKFHIYNREDLGFKWTNISSYILIQPLFLGPLIGFVLIAASIFNQSKTVFHRALQFNIGGVLLFFFILAFRLEIHKHWTSVLEVPLILLGYEYISVRNKWQIVIKNLAIASLLMIIPFRVFLAFDFFPKSISNKIEKLHNWNRWADKVKELSGGLPIMFIDQYEQASRYSYLTRTEVHCYNTFDYRETQHDYWDLEENLLGKDVFVVSRNDINPLFKVDSSEDRVKIQYRIIENFRSFRKVNIELNNVDITEKTGAVPTFTLLLTNKYEYAVNFSDVGKRKVLINAHFLKGMQSVLNERLDSLAGFLSPGSSILKKVMIKMPDEPGIYDLRFSIQVEGIDPPINSKKFKVIIQK